MKLRKLIVLGVLFLALVATVIVKRAAQSRSASRSEESAFSTEKVLEKAFAPSFASEFIIRIDGKEHLFRKDTNGLWKAVSRFGARARKDFIEDLLKKMEVLSGELRSEERSLVKDYGLTDDEAIHFIIKGSDAKMLAHLLLARERSQGSANFVREAGSGRVYLTDTDLLMKLGSFMKGIPVNDRSFIDLKLADLQAAEVSRIELTNAGQETLVVTKRPAEGDKTEGWVSGPDELKTEKIVSWITALNNLTASDTVDPAAYPESTAQKPWILIESVKAGQPSVIRIRSAAGPRDAKSSVLCVDPDGICYEVPDDRLTELKKDPKQVFAA